MKTRGELQDLCDMQIIIPQNRRIIVDLLFPFQFQDQSQAVLCIGIDQILQCECDRDAFAFRLPSGDFSVLYKAGTVNTADFHGNSRDFSAIGIHGKIRLSARAQHSHGILLVCYIHFHRVAMQLVTCHTSALHGDHGKCCRSHFHGHVIMSLIHNAADDKR